MKQVFIKIDKQLISQMPKVQFQGRIIVVQAESEVQKAVDFLKSHSVLGIDTETRPSFQRGQTHMVSLVQIATHEVCFLFRINHFGIPLSLVDLFEDRNVVKIGLSLKDDFAAMQKRVKFTPGGFIELQHYVGEFGIQDLSLQKLYANLFHEKISKAQRLSNWEAGVLTEKQKQYAATDAWACVRIYEELNRMKKTGDYELIPLKELPSEKE